MRALREFSEMYSSEDFTDLTVREILGKRLGIPNLERTDFSGRTRNEIDDAYRAWQSGDRKTWGNWHYRACKARTLTQLIKCNLTDNFCDAPDRAQKKFRWSVQVSQDSDLLCAAGHIALTHQRAALVERQRSCETTVFDGQRLAMKADDAPPPL